MDEYAGFAIIGVWGLLAAASWVVFIMMMAAYGWRK